MNISFNWLRQYLQTSLGIGELAQQLTSIGLEVESVETVEPIRGGLEGFVIGRVITCEKHPDADKLSVTTVDIGKTEFLSIVCGAPNVAAGQRVVVATIGAVIYKGEESFTIKKAKIRGVTSEGMICAEDEIGTGTGHDGILVLGDHAVVGSPARDYFGLTSDYRISIGLTPNRIDSASHVGVARDLAASLRNIPGVTYSGPDISNFSVDNESFPIEVIIENPSACRRYAGVSITGLKVAPSPQWLKDRLSAIGMNSINNVVDATNFVLHELGQPLHAFDADELRGRKIIVKNLPENTPFVTLDGVERKLSEQDLMICDAEGPVAIGGVFGGLYSGVTDKTTRIFLESAYFDPVSVRRTARRHLLNTDASFRFERGADPSITLSALKRCALLVKEVAGGNISSQIVDVHPNPVLPVQVKLTYAHTDRLIGKHLGTGEIKSILEALEFEILDSDDTGLLVAVPPCRVDVTREADVIEEILRIHGYNQVEVSDTLQSSLSPGERNGKERLTEAISVHLTSNGFNEIMCNSLTSEAYYTPLTGYPPQKLVRIINPLSNELNVMRQTLLFGGLETIRHNTNRQRPDLQLYEFGNTYTFSGKQQGDVSERFNEQYMLALFATGKVHDGNWLESARETSFYYLKSAVEKVMRLAGISSAESLAGLSDEKSELYEGLLRYQIENETLAKVAIVKPSVCQSFDIKNTVFYAEFNMALLIRVFSKFHVKYAELPKYPEVRRDLALLLNEDITCSQVREVALRTEKNLLKRISLFDVYAGERIPAGKKSYAVSFVLQDKEATLTDQRIEKVMEKLMSAYIRDLKAEIRQ